MDDTVWVPTTFTKNRDRLSEGDVARPDLSQPSQDFFSARLGNASGRVTLRSIAPKGDEMSEQDEDLKAELERLRAENEALKSQKKEGLRLQVSQKGAVSLYGIRRFPVTFYADEWDLILGQAEKIRAFIRENDGQLKRK